MPVEQEPAPPHPPRPSAPQSPQPSTPDLKKQCPRCTFLNEPSLSACEMCDAPLPSTTIAKPPSPSIARKPSHSHSASEPPRMAPHPRQETLKADQRPSGPNRHSLSASLFSIFPFAQQQQQQQENHAKVPPTQAIDTAPAGKSVPSKHQNNQEEKEEEEEPAPALPQRKTPVQASPSTPPPHSNTPSHTLLPLSPSPPSSKRPAPAGLPTNLMDDFLPVSPGLREEEGGEDAGWGDVRREEVRDAGDSGDEDEEEGKGKKGMIDLDAVAREEADVWGT